MVVLYGMANDVCVGRIRSRRFQCSREKSCNDSERDESTEEQLQWQRQYICTPRSALSLAMAMWPEHHSTHA